MIRFVLRKMVNKKWMALALLIGNILLVSVACANVMYSKAMLQRTLTKELSNELTQNGSYAGQVTVRVGSAYGRAPQTMEAAEIVRTMPAEFGIPAVEVIEHYVAGPSRTQPMWNREKGMVDSLSIGMMSGLEAHIELVAGQMYSDVPDAEGFIEVIVSEQGMADMNLLLGESFSLPNIFGTGGETLRFRVCGVFKNAQAQDIYWVNSPSFFHRECLMSERLFKEVFLHKDSAAQLGGQFHVMLDYAAMRTEDVGHILSVAQGYQEQFYNTTGQSYSDAFSTVLKEFLTTSKRVNVTVWVLQVPVFVLLAVFVFMVSQQMVELEQNEIAVFQSRGASRAQILGAYVLQSGFIAGVALAAGVLLGGYLVQVLGSANEFLEFVQRTRLPIEINGEVWLAAGAAVLFSLMTMLIPILRCADVTIVRHKQSKQRRTGAPLWQKLCLDGLLLAAAVYILYSYHNQSEKLAQRIVDGASLDPLLFVGSSLFMLGMALLALRILPFITFLIFRLFRKWLSPSLYAALLRVIRTRYSQSFIMVFLIMTIALGVFNAQAARTINGNEVDNIRYSIGADIVLQERWKDNREQRESDPSIPITYEEPDFGRYQTLKGAESVTRVLNISNASVKVSGGILKNVQVMGIHTKEFGETAWMRSDLLRHHFYEYLNALTNDSRAVLLSGNFRTDYGYELGDEISYQNAAGDTARGVVYGFVDYWAGYQPIKLLPGTDGIYRETPNYLIVANLNQLQAYWGIMPYQVWINATDSTRFIYDFAEENGIAFSSFRDTSAEIIELKNNPVFQGTNGILTIGFVVVLLLCSVGFLMYWILSIRSRALQFGIYRAMGMSMREIVNMLLCEQVFISGMSIAVGVLTGHFTARLYMPLLQMAYASYDNILPLRLLGNAGDMGRLMTVVGVVIVFCMMILSRLIAKMKIAQALKLGED